MESEEESQDFSSQMLPPGLLVVHDAPGGGEDDEPELSAREKVVGPLLDVVDRHIKPGRDDPALIESSRKIDHNLAGSVIINHLELPDVSVFHHDGEKPDDDLGAGSEQDLSLASLLSVVHAFKSIS